MQNRIESKDSFLAWCQKVNHAVSGKYADLQDDFAYSDQNDLRSYFIDMTQNEKELAIFAIQKAMGSATLFDFVRQYSHFKAQAYIDSEGAENDKRALELALAEHELKKKEDSYKLTISALGHRNTELEKDNNKMTSECSDYVKRIWALESEVDDLQAELKKLYAFESHIKSLLTN